MAIRGPRVPHRRASALPITIAPRNAQAVRLLRSASPLQAERRKPSGSPGRHHHCKRNGATRPVLTVMVPHRRACALPLEFTCDDAHGNTWPSGTSPEGFRPSHHHCTPKRASRPALPVGITIASGTAQAVRFFQSPTQAEQRKPSGSYGHGTPPEGLRPSARIL
jgi:hypothetical protein